MPIDVTLHAGEASRTPDHLCRWTARATLAFKIDAAVLRNAENWGEGDGAGRGIAAEHSPRSGASGQGLDE
jgi:hypothetical protein